MYYSFERYTFPSELVQIVELAFKENENHSNFS